VEHRSLGPVQAICYHFYQSWDFRCRQLKSNIGFDARLRFWKNKGMRRNLLPHTMYTFIYMQAQAQAQNTGLDLLQSWWHFLCCRDTADWNTVAGSLSYLWALSRNFMWRTIKASVEDQLQLLPQRSLMNVLSFSPVERFMYSKLHKECVSSMTSFLASSSLEAAMRPLLRLRQMCCHPQISRMLGLVPTICALIVCEYLL
jgi:hypothetical protein